MPVQLCRDATYTAPRTTAQLTPVLGSCNFLDRWRGRIVAHDDGSAPGPWVGSPHPEPFAKSVAEGGRPPLRTVIRQELVAYCGVLGSSPPSDTAHMCRPYVPELARPRRRQPNGCFGEKGKETKKRVRTSCPSCSGSIVPPLGSRPVTRRLEKSQALSTKQRWYLTKVAPPHYVGSNHILSD